MKHLRAAAAALAVSAGMFWSAPALSQARDVLTAPASPGVGHRPAIGDHDRSEGAGKWKGDRPDRRHRRHRRHRGFGHGYGLLPWLGYDEYEYRPFDYRDSGYFFGEGAAIATADGGVRYDYDRAYPYDHYRGEGAAAAWQSPAKTLHCRVEWTRGPRGGRVPIQICTQ